MKEKNKAPMSYEEFTKMLSEVLLVDQAKLTPEASFIDDLFVDSLKLVEMALRIDQMGVSIPTEEYWELETVGEVYEAYKEYLLAG